MIYIFFAFLYSSKISIEDFYTENSVFYTGMIGGLLQYRKRVFQYRIEWYVIHHSYNIYSIYIEPKLTYRISVLKTVFSILE